MLSGLKFIPRDQIQNNLEKNSDSSLKEKKKSSSGRDKCRRKSKKSNYICSSDDEELERIKKESRKKKKWYSSDEYSSSSSSPSETERDCEKGEKKVESWKKGKGTNYSRDKKRSRSDKKDYSSKDCATSISDDGDCEKDSRYGGRSKDGKLKRKGKVGEKNIGKEDFVEDVKDNKMVRKEMGLEWMVRAEERTDRKASSPSEPQPEELQVEEVNKLNPKELNPYLKDGSCGYPEDHQCQTNVGANQLLSSSVVGDGGASWRLKALKRAQEQAARDGRKLDQVVQERWGSLGQLAVSVASHAAAPSRAHLHAIKDRKKGLTDELTDTDIQNKRDTEKNIGRDYLKDITLRHPDMRAPKVHNSLSWGKRKGQNLSSRDSGLITTAVSSLNKFTNDGSFMREVMHQQNNDSGGSLGSSFTNCEDSVKSELFPFDTCKPGEESSVIKQELSANQLAAKALQLRIKGKPEEADKLLREAESIQAKQGTRDKLIRQRNNESSSRYLRQEMSAQRKNEEENADVCLVEKIMQNKQYSISSQADDEYDFDGGPGRKVHKRGGGIVNKLTDRANFEKRILTQQERCQFCFENPTRPRHLVVSIANFTYLMLPQWLPVVPGHCCILPLQHESATRTLDDNVWEEIRNFKKCLIMMFAKQEKDIVFLETVMGLAQQRRHCLIECIPLPRDIAKQAPLYFKKAIDEAEDEWSQHNAKKLIDTSEKGLRASIPKGFPYFHVEFGLNRGFVHVIDDEKQFRSSLGLNVIRGMLRLPEEDMHRRRKLESLEGQKQAVASFAQEWGPFDWTKQLG